MRRCSSSKSRPLPYISSAARFFGSIRLNKARMRPASFASCVIAWRTVAAISVMISWENEARAVAGRVGCDTPQRVAEQPGEIDAVLLVEFLQRPVGLRRLPDVAHDRHVDEHPIVAVGNAAQRRMQIPGMS